MFSTDFFFDQKTVDDGNAEQFSLNAIMCFAVLAGGLLGSVSWYELHQVTVECV